MNDYSEILYGSGCVYQVRTDQGNKIGEFDNTGELQFFLRKRGLAGLEIWYLNRFPGELLDVIAAKDFIQQTNQ